MAYKLDIEQLLGRTLVFGDLDASRLGQMARASRQLHVPKQHFVFRRGEVATGLYVVAGGCIKLSIPALNGNEKVLDFFGPGQSFGESGMLLERPYIVDAQALEDSSLICMDRQDVHVALEQDPAFSRFMLMSLARRMDSLVQDIEAVNLQTAGQRLVCYLLRQPREDSCTRFPFSKRLVASKLGLSPETLSRLLHQLSSDGLISVHGRIVTIHQFESLRVLQFTD